MKTIKDYKLLAHYPNNTKLVETDTKDDDGNTQLLIDENNCLLTDTYFSGVVYIDKHEFEVYQNSDFRKTGIFNLKTGIDWTAKTPRQKCNEASALFNLKLKERIENSALKCFCEYPRIIDYIENRGSTDSSYLQMEFQNNFLVISSSTFNQDTEEETINYHCKYCSSEYTRRYRERGMVLA